MFAVAYAFEKTVNEIVKIDRMKKANE